MQYKKGTFYIYRVKRARMSKSIPFVVPKSFYGPGCLTARTKKGGAEAPEQLSVILIQPTVSPSPEWALSNWITAGYKSPAYIGAWATLSTDPARFWSCEVAASCWSKAWIFWKRYWNFCPLVIWPCSVWRQRPWTLWFALTSRTNAIAGIWKFRSMISFSKTRIPCCLRNSHWKSDSRSIPDLCCCYIALDNTT